MPSGAGTCPPTVPAPGRHLLECAAPGHVEAVRRAVFDALTPAQLTLFAEVGEAVDAALQRMDADGADPEPLPWHRRWAGSAR
ncbi:hypothetical protein AB0N99_12145 [Streptomyces sp. NPDC093272]|uniref:hypothetical protein n=1 Tax=Streptomyces sp. NPDC093272 TaxID=3154981 RepID=UPI00343C37CC